MTGRIERITPVYRGVMIASTPGVVWWGRRHVTGLELLALEGPLLVVGDHDSYWDTVATGIAAMPRRQIRALAKSSMWKNRVLGRSWPRWGRSRSSVSPATQERLTARSRSSARAHVSGPTPRAHARSAACCGRVAASVTWRAPGESPQQYSTRLLAQLRQRAPIEVAGRARAAALVGRLPTWSTELAITGKPGGKGALDEALAQTAAKQD
jgi:hypothetical protein